jgi:serine/threonine protein kinase
LRQARAASGVVQLLDSFVHKGPNGDHQCLVFELLGPAVETVVLDYAGGGDHLDTETIIGITRRLLKTLSAMHRAGYAHGGLLRPPLLPGLQWNADFDMPPT